MYIYANVYYTIIPEVDSGKRYANLFCIQYNPVYKKKKKYDHRI